MKKIILIEDESSVVSFIKKGLQELEQEYLLNDFKKECRIENWIE